MAPSRILGDSTAMPKGASAAAPGTSRALPRALLLLVSALTFAGLAAMIVARPDVDPADLLQLQPQDLPELDPAAVHIPAFEARLVDNPRSATDHTILAALYERHVGESGDESVLPEVERLLRRGIDLRPGLAGADAALARALNKQHRFAEAAEIAGRVVARDGALQDRVSAVRTEAVHSAGKAARGEDDAEPDAGAAAALATLFDARMGLGDYAGAEAALAALVDARSGPAVLARQAQLAELRGHDDRALALLARAGHAAHAAYVPRGEMAWYLYRIAELVRTRGRHDAALRYADTALRIAPGHLPALGARARALAALGRFDAAIAEYERLAASMPHPEILAALGDLYALVGRDDVAEARWAAALAAGDEAGDAEDRPMARLLADHDWRAPEAVERARRDLKRRQDVDGWDALAWALYRDGRHEAAAAAIEEALAHGTRRASFHYHAGLIHRALGDRDRARDHLRVAMEIDPAFDPVHGPAARRALAVLS